MPPPPKPADPAAAPKEWFRGRLAPPGFGFESVPTRAMSMLLKGDVRPKLVTVTGPPGYGKTVLLSQLHQRLTQKGERCLWLTLDDRDRDVLSVLWLLKSALEQNDAAAPRPDLVVRAFTDRTAVMDTVLGQLNQLGQSAGITALFIDNLGVCTDPDLALLLERLVFDSPPGLRVLVSSTRELPVDLLRAKLELGALDVGPAQLVLDRQATRQLLTLAGLAEPSDRDMDRILLHTEGWPAAVRLLQVLMSSEIDESSPLGNLGGTASVLQRFGGDQRDIARVLTHRVLVGFEPEQVAFMSEIALVREFNAELALHMTGRAQARTWLDALVKRNLLVFPLDTDRRWFRFHTLLREYLLAEANELTPTRRHEVLQRAARWLAERGDHVTAIGIALDGRDHALAGTLIDKVARDVAGDRGQMTPFIDWVDRLMHAGLLPSVETQSWYVWALCHTMQYERARLALAAFDRRLAESDVPGPPDQGDRAHLTFSRMVVHLILDSLDETHAHAMAWLSSNEPHDPLQSGTVAAMAALAEIDSGDIHEASHHLDQAEGAIGRASSIFTGTWVAILRAAAELAMARPDAADKVLREARATTSAALGEDAGIVSVVDFVHVRVLLDLGRVSEADALARRSLPQAGHHGVVNSAELGLSACVALLPPDFDTQTYDTDLDQVARKYPPRLQRLLDAQRVRRLLQASRVREAAELAETCGLLAEAPERSAPTGMRQRGDWLLAGVETLVAQGLCEVALARIDTEARLAHAQGRVRDRIELLLAAMDAHLRMAHPPRALRALSTAISLAAPGRLVHPFLARQPMLQQVFATYGLRDFGFTQPAEVRFLERLMAQVEPSRSTPDAVPDAGDSTLQRLTLREAQLVEFIGQGLSNQQVADKLSLSVPTVKWHLSNLYGKLGVRSRSAALAKVRAFELLTPPEH